MSAGEVVNAQNIIGEIAVGDTKRSDLEVKNETCCSSCGYEMVYCFDIFFCPKCARVRKWVWLL